MATPWTGTEILQATGARRLCGDPETAFGAVAIDSRRVSETDLFVAIRGERHDAHRFLPDVVEKGCRGLLIETEKVADLPIGEWDKKGLFAAAVGDGVRALGDLAGFLRRRWGGSAAAITGSNGKTTTRRMTAEVMSRRFHTLATRGNFNNLIGLPLTLFDLTPDHEWAVVELGMNAPGEIGRLAEIARPDIGVITNIGPAHLEGLGSMENILAAKAELLTGLGPEGTAVLNADDPRLSELAGILDRRCLLFGIEAVSGDRAQIRAGRMAPTAAGTDFSLKIPGGTATVSLAAPGDFMVSNALAAAAVGHLAGLSAAEIAAGLSAFRPVQGRMNIRQTPEGIFIIDDTYNANPGSMAAALKTLKRLKGRARGFFAAGDMYELGGFAESLHRELGKTAAASDLSGLFATGRLAPEVAAGATEAGMDPAAVFCGSPDEICDRLREILKPGDWLLVKGSRAMKMECISGAFPSQPLTSNG
jgi:UDP-N-acetylmuramoyl-tripeptide--D-alanyl-D-alanine ligase